MTNYDDSENVDLMGDVQLSDDDYRYGRRPRICHYCGNDVNDCICDEDSEGEAY